MARFIRPPMMVAYYVVFLSLGIIGIGGGERLAGLIIGELEIHAPFSIASGAIAITVLAVCMGGCVWAVFRIAGFAAVRLGVLKDLRRSEFPPESWFDEYSNGWGLIAALVCAAILPAVAVLLISRWL